MYTVPLVQWAPMKDEKMDVVVHSIGMWYLVDRRGLSDPTRRLRIQPREANPPFRRGAGIA